MGNRILEGWVVSCIITWLLFANKPKEITPATVGASLFCLLMLPVWLIVFVPLFYSDRKKLKWLRKKWLLISIKNVVDYSMGWKRYYSLKAFDAPR
jgi:hypothetical protein